MMPRFRLSTLFWLTTVAAGVLTYWVNTGSMRWGGVYSQPVAREASALTAVVIFCVSRFWKAIKRDYSESKAEWDKEYANVGKVVVPALILSLLLACSANAEWPYDAVCAISCGENGGSGTLVGVDDNGNGIVVSAAHVFEGVNQRNAACLFPAFGETWIPARLAGFGRNDSAVLFIKAPAGIHSPRSVRPAREEDGPFVAVGFPYYSRTSLRYSTGDYIGHTNSGGEFQFSAHSHSGMSGGAVFNRHGDFVGVISGNKAVGMGAPWDRIWGAGGTTLSSLVGRYMEVGQ